MQLGGTRVWKCPYCGAVMETDLSEYEAMAHAVSRGVPVSGLGPVRCPACRLHLPLAHVVGSKLAERLGLDGDGGRNRPIA